MILYVYGSRICLALYDITGLTGDLRREVNNSYWDLRFGLYSVIIAILFYVSRNKLSVLNKSLVSIGYTFALFSSIDKLILKQFEQSVFDYPIMLFIILFELIKHEDYIIKRFKFLK